MTSLEAEKCSNSSCHFIIITVKDAVRVRVDCRPYRISDEYVFCKQTPTGKFLYSRFDEKHALFFLRLCYKLLKDANYTDDDALKETFRFFQTETLIYFLEANEKVETFHNCHDCHKLMKFFYGDIDCEMRLAEEMGLKYVKAT